MHFVLYIQCIKLQIIILLVMNRNRPYLNRFVKQKQLQLTDIYHDLNMREIKPITTRLMEHSDTFAINNSKREMIKEVRDIEIERENKLLLNKIGRVMSKKGNYSVLKTKSLYTKANKSLNDIVRRKQLQSIQTQNKRFLMRLQNRRATVDTMKLRRDWQDNKSVIKRMTNYEFNMTHFKTKDSRIRSFTSDRLTRIHLEQTKINKMKLIDGRRMFIKVEFADGLLKIVGDCRDHKDLKVIQIPKEEALLFIQKDCEGKVEKILDKLKYDEATQTLFLISQNIEDGELNPEGKGGNNKINIPMKAKSTIEYTPRVNPQEAYHYQTISHRTSEPPVTHQFFQSERPQKSKQAQQIKESTKKLKSNTSDIHESKHEQANLYQKINPIQHQEEAVQGKVSEEAPKQNIDVLPQSQQAYNQQFDQVASPSHPN